MSDASGGCDQGYPAPGATDLPYIPVWYDEIDGAQLEVPYANRPWYLHTPWAENITSA